MTGGQRTTVDEFLEQLAPHQLGWPQSLRWTYDKTRELLAAGVDGCLVECGVAAGVHPAVMARACQDSGVARTVHLFDSFEGVPHGSSEDGDWNQHWGDGSGRLENTGVAVCSLANVEANLRRWGVLDSACDFAQRGPEGRWAHVLCEPFWFHIGWFQDVLPNVPETLGPIAFLRLDGDLYDSYAVCLGHLYDLISPGGILVADDLNLDGCRQALRDFGLGPEAFTAITESGDGWMVKP